MSDVNDALEHAPPAPSLREALITALGLPTETYLVEFLLSDIQAPVIHCHYYPTPEAMQRATVVLAEYQVVAKPAPGPVPFEGEAAVPPTPEADWIEPLQQSLEGEMPVVPPQAEET